ncbi:MAG: hypothetical protein GTO02_11245 [Candidatus Dadabacteria bacterium]|nr:hypothetical protein [Candidatus Dadabacteria bacterium]NIQ14935.1 hypothetical protein [Candidatus Dadabacteria bacterium]
MYENPNIFSIKDLSDVKKIGQVIMPRIDFNDSDSILESEKLVKDYGVCGFIIFNGTIDRARETINRLQSLTTIPLLFACDAERGLSQVLKGATYFPFLMSQGSINDVDLLKEQARVTSQEMAYCGFNLIFAPVLDTNLNVNNPIINIRSFGDDKSLVANLGSEYIQEIQKNGIFACGKHFPGHGSTDKDSHELLPVVNKTLADMQDTELVPFKRAIEYKVSCIMPAHISYPRMDESSSAATVSKIILEDILRENLGFNGLVISDSFKMDALSELGSENIIAKKAIKSGVDIILDPKDPKKLIVSLSNDINLISDSLQSSLKRISYYKSFLKYKRNEKPIPDFTENSKVSKLISERSVCRLKGGEIKNKEGFVYIYDYDNKPFDDLFKILDMNFKMITGDDIDDKLKNSTDTSLICIISTKVAAWTDSNLLPAKVKVFINKFSKFKNEKILLNFGSPYIVKEFDFFDTVIACFDSTTYCQRAVAKVLLGKIEAQGVLPVKL